MLKLFTSIILSILSAGLFAQVNSHNLNIVDFHSVSVNSRYTVYVKQSNKEEVKVEAQKELYDISEFYVEEGVLHIDIKREDSKDKSVLEKLDNIKLLPTLKVYVSIKDVQNLWVNGNGRLITENSIAADNLTIAINGQGSVDADVKGKNLDIAISGPGKMKLKGYADDMKLTMTGAGDLEAYECELATSSAKLYGLGSAQLNISDKLDVSIYGSGSVEVKGATKEVEKHIYGPGNVERTY